MTDMVNSKSPVSLFDYHINNLETLSRVEVYDKIILGNGEEFDGVRVPSIQVDKSGWFQGLWRYWYGESRVKSIGSLIEYMLQVLKYYNDLVLKYKEDEKTNINYSCPVFAHQGRRYKKHRSSRREKNKNNGLLSLVQSVQKDTIPNELDDPKIAKLNVFIHKARVGIKNLMLTYDNDIDIKGQLDNVENRIGVEVPKNEIVEVQA